MGRHVCIFTNKYTNIKNYPIENWIILLILKRGFKMFTSKTTCKDMTSVSELFCPILIENSGKELSLNT